MKTVGIIAEYNPFHNGHKYHIEKAKEITGADTVVVIMSGNFVQRGEPAIMNKWKRAESALYHGADLVIELPTYFALSSAEMFAYGSVSLLDSLEIDTIVFGSEHGEIEPFYKLAGYLIDLEEKHIDALQKLMKDGHPFPVARSLLMKKLFDLTKEEENLLNAPNNILGVEYLKSILRLKSPLKANTIQRKGSHYHSTNIDEQIASATAIRKFLIEKTAHGMHLTAGELLHIQRQVPSQSFKHLQGSSFLNGDSVFSLLRYKLMTSSAESLRKVHDVREGLEHKILKSYGVASSYNDLITRCKSKRYTYTRLSRIMMKSLLDISSEDVGYIKDAKRPEYARILGFTALGSQYLKVIRKNERIQLVTNLKNYKTPSEASVKMLEKDILATNIYSEFDESIRFGEDHYHQPHVIKD